jgi:hypothetical protein
MISKDDNNSILKMKPHRAPPLPPKPISTGYFKNIRKPPPPPQPLPSSVQQSDIENIDLSLNENLKSNNESSNGINFCLAFYFILFFDLKWMLRF